MIQYDRTSGIFVLSDRVPDRPNLDICAKLNENLAKIRTWLNLKRRNGRYAHGFLVELAINCSQRLLDVHAIYDEIGKLEGTDSVPSITKKPRRMRGPLRGYWHKHYFQPSSLLRNLNDELEKMHKDGRLEAILGPHYGKYIPECINQISHEVVIGAYEQRARQRRTTGEFFVYERQADDSNYYLTLGKHGEWDAILARVQEYKKFDAGG